MNRATQPIRLDETTKLRYNEAKEFEKMLGDPIPLLGFESSPLSITNILILSYDHTT